MLLVSVGDADSDASALAVTATSLLPGLTADPLVSDCELPGERSLSFSPLSDANGEATITVTVTDGLVASRTDSFIISVRPVNDPRWHPRTGHAGCRR